jgi:hypothetical protein
MFVIGLALACEWWRHHRSAAVRNFAIVLILALLGYNYVLMALYQTNRIDRGDHETGGWNPAGAPIGLFEEMERRRQASQRPSPVEKQLRR